MTYARCNLAVKPELHGMALRAYTGCGIVLPMESRRTYFREWRRHRHLTQAQVIERLEALDDPHLPRTEASLSRIESGAQNYTSRMLYALADIYDCEVGDLFSRDPGKEGTLVDLVSRLPARQQEQAIAVIEGLVLAEKRQGFTAAPDPAAPLRKRG